MKIIKKGSLKQKTCHTCNCIFEYDVSDIKYIGGMTCMNKGTDIIYCPQCGERIDEKCGFAVNCFGHLK